MGKATTFLAGLAAAALLPGGAAASDNVALSGTVLYQGKPMAGASVSVLGSTATTGPDGAFRIEGVPALHVVGFRHFERAKDGVLEYQDVLAPVPLLMVAAYGEREEKGFLGLTTRKVELGAAQVVASGDARKPISLDLQPVADWETFCRRCHPTSPGLEPGVAKRPAKPEKPKPEVTRDLYTIHRYRDVHPSGFDYGKTVARAPRKTAFADKVAELPLADGKRVDCRTCHTFHRAGSVPAFVRAEFREKNDLCQRCHR